MIALVSPHARLTVQQLKAECKARKLRGYSRLRKADLLRLLDRKPEPRSPTVAELKAEAKALGLKGYSRLRKIELIQLIGGYQVGRKLPIDREPLILNAISDLTIGDVEYRDAMRREMTGIGNASTNQVLRSRRVIAIRRLRDDATDQGEWQAWNEVHAREAAGI